MAFETVESAWAIIPGFACSSFWIFYAEPWVVEKPFSLYNLISEFILQIEFNFMVSHIQKTRFPVEVISAS